MAKEREERKESKGKRGKKMMIRREEDDAKWRLERTEQSNPASAGKPSLFTTPRRPGLTIGKHEPPVCIFARRRRY